MLKNIIFIVSGIAAIIFIIILSQSDLSKTERLLFMLILAESVYCAAAYKSAHTDANQ